MKTITKKPPLDNITRSRVERFTPRYNQICKNTYSWDSLDQAKLVSDYTELFGAAELAGEFVGVTRVTLKRKSDNQNPLTAKEMIAMLDALTKFNSKYAQYRPIVNLSKSLF